MSWGLLWLEGPLQAWGHDSRFGVRSTLPFPTRSGILGMICCALGRGGEQREWLARMRGLEQIIVGYARKNMPRPAMLRDFHMVGSGYNLKDPWEDLFVPQTGEGKHPVGTGARMTNRFYLQDMAFACVLEILDEDDLGTAFATPAWPIFLGRKCCVPTDIIWRGKFATSADALAEAARIAQKKKLDEIFQVVEGEMDGDKYTLNDIPVCFGPYKKYADRVVTLIHNE